MFIKNEKRKIKDIEGKSYIFDIIRKKYILLTPEEIVRQNFLDYLILEKNYSKNLIKLESALKYNTLKKRSDILVYDKLGKPFLLVECKAEIVAISQLTIEQASRYNLQIKAPFVCITNGFKTYCFKIDFDDNSITQLNAIPEMI
ncbi:MAG: type I restriction enzyme HsdR N-terminal domain-containing protein [Leadbetterella sp.]|nr:type I restriction enzyme HsdR N-terminal domain-containing protein [Leadbetterella sp.]